MEKRRIENHPFEPFMPGNAKVLMLGSFPPPERRWSMRFYYPNRTNDMWRIMGIVFFGDKNHFVRPGGYDEQAIRRFAAERGIAMFDAAVRVVRQKDNASDKFLEVVEPIDLDGFLDRLPDCRTAVPKTGEYVEFTHRGNLCRHYRMVSSSRAYPLAVEKKAEKYAEMFREIGVE